jgi:hypothetical protein
MKRIIPILIAAVMLFSLVSCSNQDEKTSSSDAAVSSETQINTVFAEYAKQGRIDGALFGLGTKPSEIKEYYHYEDEEYWQDPSEVTDQLTVAGDSRVRMYVGDTRYYYYAKDEADGISFIVYYQTAYNYVVGISSIEDVKSTIGMEPSSEGDAASEELFFFPGEPENIYRVSYKVNDYTVTFFFADGLLCATTIADDTLWSV